MPFILPLLLAVTAINLARTATVYESFRVDSVIVSRYARTTVTSVIYNSAPESGEASFQVQLPSTAFISNFTMQVNDTTYLGVADDKQSAAEEFNRRQEDGENVGLVESRGTDVFQIRANTAAQSRSTFTLTYEELITRTLSKYKQVISLNPGSLVDNLSVSVRVVDSQGIASFSSTNFTSSNRISSDEVQFSYAPSKSDQNDNKNGLSRNIVIEYDVNHPTDTSAGLVIVNDCYFAQFFSPGGVASIPVDIVFVIDTSGSMSGTKISQARSSLIEVISQLSGEDRFTIVTFSSSVGFWRDSLMSVGEFRQQGQSFARGLGANGGTDFFGGLERGIEILKSSQNSQYVQLLVMLSDGEPTVGVVDHDLIVRRATELTTGTRISLNMLGFGVNLNLLLLQRLALANRGIVRQIFEGADAASQLEGFYQSISNPILHTLGFSYPTNQIESVSNVAFPLLFQGSEVVVAGKFTDSVCNSGNGVSISVSGTGQSAVQTFTSVVDPSADTIIAGIKPDTERLVAYLTTQQLLNDIKVTSEAGAKVIEERAKELALRYNFVTELTSLIVVEEDVYNEVIMNNSTNFTETFGGVGRSVENEMYNNVGSSSLNRFETIQMAYTVTFSSLLVVFTFTFGDGAGAEAVRSSVLELALGYNFVTDLTSLIVVEETSYRHSVSINSTNFNESFVPGSNGNIGENEDLSVFSSIPPPTRNSGPGSNIVYTSSSSTILSVTEPSVLLFNLLALLMT